MSQYKPICIRVFYADTLKYEGIYNSYHEFRIKYGLRKLDRNKSDAGLYRDELIKIGKFLVCINSRKWSEALRTHIKKQNQKDKIARIIYRGKIRKRGLKIAKNMILILGADFSIKSVWLGTVKNLAKKEKIPLGNLKSQMSRAPRFLKTYLTGGLGRWGKRHYIRLKDYIR